jgi:hypothetical protein
MLVVTLIGRDERKVGNMSRLQVVVESMRTVESGNAIQTLAGTRDRANVRIIRGVVLSKEVIPVERLFAQVLCQAGLLSFRTQIRPANGFQIIGQAGRRQNSSCLR